jgi:hypothetical protein
MAPFVFLTSSLTRVTLENSPQFPAANMLWHSNNQLTTEPLSFRGIEKPLKPEVGARSNALRMLTSSFHPAVVALAIVLTKPKIFFTPLILDYTT